MDLDGVLVEDQKRDTLLWAGKVQIRITDWFFLKDQADLKYIGLENAVAKFNRTDSVWNYTFLEKYFASTSTSSKKKAGITFNLKKVLFTNVSFEQKDEWAGELLTAKVSHLDLDAKNINIAKKKIDINSLKLIDPYFHTYSYKGRRPYHPITIKEKAAQPWDVAIAELVINGGHLKLDNNSLTPTVNYFDSKHLDFTSINTTIKNLRWQGDTLRANVDLATTERSGLQVKTLKGALKMTPQVLEFANFYLQTNESILRNYFAMRFDSLGSLNDIEHAVKMDANFVNSEIASNDVALFAPYLKTWHRKFGLNGKIKGTVDDLSGKAVTIQSGSTFFNGDFNIIGLPNINKSYINATASDLHTTYTDLSRMFPDIRKVTMPDFKRISYLHFHGTFTGFLNDFVTYGTIQTNLGTLVTDLNMKLPKGGLPAYSGSLTTKNFQLGRFFNNPDLGTVSFNGDVKGRGFTNSQLDLTLNGKVQKIQYNGYTYQNITAKGKISKNLLNGDFTMNDPNAAVHLTGLIDLSKALPRFDVKATIDHADLQAMGLTKNSLKVKGKFDLNFTGNNLNDFYGTARLSEASLLQGDKRLSFDSLYLSSTIDNGVRTLYVSSNEFEGRIMGKFDLASLPDAVKVFLNRYYPSYIPTIKKQIANQSFIFDITTHTVDDYVKLIDKRLSGFNNSHLNGSLDMASNSLQLNANVPQFSFDKYDFNNVNINAQGDLNRLNLRGSMLNTTINDNLSLPETNFSINASNDVSDISITTTSNQTINKANLSAQVTTYKNGGLSLLINKPSSFVVNGKTWSIEQGGALDLRNNTSIPQGELVLKESNQEIRIKAHPSEESSGTDVLVGLHNINLGDISPLISKKQRIEGFITGDVHIDDPLKSFNVESDNIEINSLRLDNDSLGNFLGSVTYNNKSGLLGFKSLNTDPEHKIEVNGNFNLKDTTGNYKNIVHIKPTNFSIKILELFLGNLFSDMQGFLTGNLDVELQGDEKRFIGKGRLHNAGLKVKFTQVFYTVEDGDIELTENEIKLGTLTIHDYKGNTATVKGSIRHHSFENMNYNIEVRTVSPQMLLLNTGFTDNQVFYGHAWGAGALSLVGPQYDMNMFIDIKASSIDSSFITLPPSRASRETGEAGFLIERKYGREMSGEELKGAETNITYDVNLTANPMVFVNVQLDPLTGDELRGRGNGFLKIHAGTTSPLSLSGRYTIDEGSYLFTFQSFFKKPFIIKRDGNNYIEWSGNPYDATVHLDAVYTAKDVYLTNLANNLLGGSTSGLSQSRGNIDIVTTLNGALFHPNISFQLSFPTNTFSNQTSAFAFQQAIQQIEHNQNEINKQVASLIVFNSFAPLTNTNSAFQPLNEFAYSTISGFLFGEINKQLNQALGKLLKTNNLTFTFSGSLYNRKLIDQNTKGFNINQSNISFTVGKAFFNDRFIVSFGSTFDVPIQSDIQQNIQFLPDVTAEWLINKNGTVRATFFYRQNLDFLNGTAQVSSGLRTQRAGASLSYRKEFNLLKNLFTRKKDKLQLPADSTNVKKDTILINTSSGDH
ncbi:MAG: hypothetical protein C4330_05085 [Chitinophagaceae bacterium]